MRDFVSPWHQIHLLSFERRSARRQDCTSYLLLVFSNMVCLLSSLISKQKTLHPLRDEGLILRGTTRFTLSRLHVSRGRFEGVTADVITSLFRDNGLSRR